MSDTTFLVAVVPENEFASLSAGLQGAGVTVFRAEGLDDPALCLALRPDVILCDADWFDWRQALRAVQHLETPVVFLSSDADERLWMSMLTAGAFDLVRKPCLPNELCWVVNSAAGQRQSRQKAAHAA